MDNSISNARLIKTDHPEYVAFMRRMKDRNPSRGGPRAAGEVLGGLVEQAVRHWLGGHVPLLEERILSWEQRQRNGRFDTLFRELDGIWQIDAESFCLYEMKLTFPENMERGVGLSQLNASSTILFSDRTWNYILKRLVYIADEPLVVRDGLPELAPNDEYEELGVVWVKPAEVEAAAKELGIELPEDWLTPEAREGVIEDPEREEWRQYADTEKRDAEGEPVADNPLANALSRLLPGTGTTDGKE